MSDNSETVEDTKKCLLAEVTDDSCIAKFIEIVPFDRRSDQYQRPGFIHPVVEVKPEDLDEMKQEPADENDNGDSYCYVKQELADEWETDAAHFIIKVSFQAIIAIVQLSSVCVYFRFVFSTLMLLVVDIQPVKTIKSLG